MTIKVLLADSSHFMRRAIMRLLNEEPVVALVGETASYAETLEVTAALNPDILLLDPHMPDECDYPPALVKSSILVTARCVVAISFWKDAAAADLAASFGALALLDKTKLYSELIPAIRRFAPQSRPARDREYSQESHARHA